MSFKLFSDNYLKSRRLFGGIDRTTSRELLSLSRHTTGPFRYNAQVRIGDVHCTMSINQPTVLHDWFHGTINLFDTVLSWMFNYSPEHGGPVLMIDDTMVGKTIKTTGYRHHLFEIRVSTASSWQLHDPFVDVSLWELPMELIRSRFGFGRIKIGDVDEDLSTYHHLDKAKILAVLASALTYECGLHAFDRI